MFWLSIHLLHLIGPYYSLFSIASLSSFNYAFSGFLSTAHVKSRVKSIITIATYLLWDGHNKKVFLKKI